MDDMASTLTPAATGEALEVTPILHKVAMPHLATVEHQDKDTADPTLLQLPHREVPMEALLATIW